MNIEKTDLLTLNDKNEYVVVNIINYNNKNYYYLADINNQTNLKFCYIDGNELVEVRNGLLISKLISLFEFQIPNL